MAYPSAVQTPTDYTPYFLLYGKEMRIPLDLMYRPPSLDVSRAQYAHDIRKTLINAYKITREKLNFAHERQKDYCDRRTRGTRVKLNNFVWLWSPVVFKGVAPKFYMPRTRQFKFVRRLSDVTYEILDLVKNLNKIVHFDRLKKSVVTPQTPVISENEYLDSSFSDEAQYEAPLAKPERRATPLNNDSVPDYNSTEPTEGTEAPAPPAPAPAQLEPRRMSARSTKDGTRAVLLFFIHDYLYYYILSAELSGCLISLPMGG